MALRRGGEGTPASCGENAVRPRRRQPGWRAGTGAPTGRTGPTSRQLPCRRSPARRCGHRRTFRRCGGGPDSLGCASGREYEKSELAVHPHSVDGLSPHRENRAALRPAPRRGSTSARPTPNRRPSSRHLSTLAATRATTPRPAESVRGRQGVVRGIRQGYPSGVSVRGRPTTSPACPPRPTPGPPPPPHPSAPRSGRRCAAPVREAGGSSSPRRNPPSRPRFACGSPAVS